MIDTDMAEQILQGDDTHPDILQALGLELLAEVKRLRERNDWLCWAIADITKSMNEDWRPWQRALKEMIE